MCSIVYDEITDSKVCGLIMNTKIEIYYERNIFPSDLKKPFYTKGLLPNFVSNFRVRIKHIINMK